MSKHAAEAELVLSAIKEPEFYSIPVFEIWKINDR